MNTDFKIYPEGDRPVIERLVYPRFKGIIAFDSEISDIENIEWLDSTADPISAAKAMREAGEYLANFKPPTE